MQNFEGVFHNAKDFRFGIVVARFNERITRELLRGALDACKRHGIPEENISVAWVPGALEIPVTLQKMAKSQNLDALIGLGCVIKGATDHYEHVCAQSASGMNQLALTLEKPVINCILTTETIEQAVERAGTKCGNKGFETTVAAIEMASLFTQL